MAIGDYSKTTYVEGSAPGISAQRLNNAENKINEIDKDYASHKADDVKHIDYAVANGTNTYTATIANITALVEGLSIKVKFTNANTGASTLNINSLGAVSIKKGNGNDVVSGNIKSGQICHLVYTGSVFQLLGEGGEYGTASASDVRSTKTLGTPDGVIQGTLDLSKVNPTNIRKDVSIAGVIGSLIPKYFASVGAVTSSDTIQFDNLNGSSLWFYYITVTGLTFKPSVIIVKYVSDSYTYVAIYEENGNDNYIGAIVRSARYGVSGSDNYYSYALKGDTRGAVVTNGSFTIPCPQFGSKTSVQCYIYG